jgi:AraC family transcriptional regulator
MEPSIEILSDQPVLGIRTPVKVSEIGARIGELMPRLMSVAGPHVAGPVVSRWHAWTGEAGEMELAVPVREAVEGGNGVEAATLPGGRAAVFVHTGSYEGLPDAWRVANAWVKEQGHACRAAPWEEYLDDCKVTPVEQVRTRIVIPIG